MDALAGNGVPARLEAATAYPFEETIRLHVSPERDAEFPLYFRLPEWSRSPSFNQSPSIKVNGVEIRATNDGADLCEWHGSGEREIR